MDSGTVLVFNLVGVAVVLFSSTELNRRTLERGGGPHAPTTAWGKTSATLPLSSATWDALTLTWLCWYPCSASLIGSRVLSTARSVVPWLCPCPWSWNNSSPNMLDANPRQPTIITSFGFETTWGSTKRWMASRKIDIQSATRNTPFTRAPSVSARCHCNHVRPEGFGGVGSRHLLTPYVYIAELLLLFATLTAHKPTHSDRTSLS